MTNSDVIQAIQHLEQLVKNNYTNLDNRIMDLKKDVREDINELKELNKNLQSKQQSDHDEIIKTSQDMKNLEKDIKQFQTREEGLGKATSAKIHHVENKVNSLSFGIGKMIGLVAGGGVVSGLIIALALFLFRKVF